MPSTGDLAYNPGMCPDWELNQQLFGSQASAQTTEPHQPGLECKTFRMLWVGLVVGRMGGGDDEDEGTKADPQVHSLSNGWAVDKFLVWTPQCKTPLQTEFHLLHSFPLPADSGRNLQTPPFWAFGEKEDLSLSVKLGKDRS